MSSQGVSQGVPQSGGGEGPPSAVPRRPPNVWNNRVASWQHQVHAGPAFASIRDAVLERAAPRPDDRCADLGAGTGFVTIPLATQVRSVVAVDVAPGMLTQLEADAPPGVTISTIVADLAELDLPAGSLDLVVSSYALHHLHHDQKRALVARAAKWLAPGGRIVIADMMFGRGASREDRSILGRKVMILVRKGPGGWWRIAKNAVRFGLRVGSEQPAAPEWWLQALGDAGLTGVRFERLVAEAGLVVGYAPAAPSTATGPAQDQVPGGRTGPERPV
jgi:SAM-dependent methyltransferase